MPWFVEDNGKKKNQSRSVNMWCAVNPWAEGNLPLIVASASPEGDALLDMIFMDLIKSGTMKELVGQRHERRP